MTREANQTTTAIDPRADTLADRRRFMRRASGAAAILGIGGGGGALWYYLANRNAKIEETRRRIEESPSAVSYKFEVVNTYPHDSDAFTQGLEFVDGQLYESTGLEGKSTVRKVNFQTGKVEQSVALKDPEQFGEGITIVNDEIYQLTWQHKRGYVYDRKTFQVKREFRYGGEGWGLTHDDKRLIMSNGTDELWFREPGTFRHLGDVKVRLDGEPLDRLNELEYIDGEVLANIWETDWIARIDPKTGKVTGKIDLSALWPAERRPDNAAVLNGIAYEREKKRLFVTGKLWPKLYEIRLVKA